jgi:large subunit ribosomal protein L18
LKQKKQKKKKLKQKKKKKQRKKKNSRQRKASKMYVAKFRRHREGKTDYEARAALLEAGMPRIVLRKTNRYIIAQIVKSKEAQDRVLCTASSKELLDYGAEGFSLKSIPLAYLTGFLLGKKAAAHKIKSAILDLGLARSTAGSRLYAALKGALEAGLEIPHNSKMLPSKERLEGQHLKKPFEVGKIKQKIEEKLKK